VEPAVAYFDGRLSAESNVLTDDTRPPVLSPSGARQWQITDQYSFRYQNATGDTAYATAVRDGYFAYIALDGAWMMLPAGCAP